MHIINSIKIDINL